MKQIVIQILNFNTYRDTIKLCDYLLSSQSNIDFSILIVDNYSVNDSFKILNTKFKHNSRVDIIRTDSNLGFARGNNFGLNYLEKINPEYVLVINNDIWFDLKILEELLIIYTKLDKPAIISPIQKKTSGENESFHSLKRASFFDDLMSNFFLYNYLRKKHKYIRTENKINAQRVDIIPGCFLLIKYDLFKSIGFFYSKTFLFCEERFLSKKIEQLGYYNYILLDFYYIHDHSKTIKKEVSLVRQQELMLEGKIIYTRKYRSFPNIKIFLLRMLHYIWRTQSYLYHKIK